MLHCIFIKFYQPIICFQLSKKKYIEAWLKESVNLSFHDDIQVSPDDEFSSHIQIVYSDSTSSEREDFHSVSSYGSPAGDGQMETDYPLYFHGNDIQDGFQLYSSESGQNFSYLPRSVSELTSNSNRNSTSHVIESTKEGNELTLRSLRTTEPSKVQRNVKATLAHAALSAVMESDETLRSPSTWFIDGQREEQVHKVRRSASTGSLNDSLLHLKNETVDKNKELETSNVKLGSETQAKKVFGHYRSKSDQIGVQHVPNSLEDRDFVVIEPKQSERGRQQSFHSVSQLSSSLPTTRSGKKTIFVLFERHYPADE